MTYEKFAISMTSKSNNNLTRKDIRTFSIRYALLLFLSSFSISTVISSVGNVYLSCIFLMLSLFLYLLSFDLFVENNEVFTKVNNIIKFWWLVDGCVFLISFLLNFFVF